MNSNCSGCSACYNICPQKCISMVEDDEGFLYPQIDHDECIDCGMCKKVCPVSTTPNFSASPAFYSCKNKDEGIRMRSSSGGVFFSLAKYILSQNGVAFGAAFDENMELKHTGVTNIIDLSKLMGSKYLQSNLAKVFAEVKTHLCNNQLVLFSGTPCQIAGLKSFLQEDYESLYLIDLVCHGVSSPKVFMEYIRAINTKHKTTVIETSFRDKRFGWENLILNLRFQNGREVCLKDSAYYNGFLSNLFLRPSCHDCGFKDFRSGSDMTIGDFWGIKDFDPHFYDEKGVSLVIVKTNKGAELFSKISEDLHIIPSNFEDATRGNPCLCSSVKSHRNRERFFREFKDSPSAIESVIKSNLPNFRWDKERLKFGIFGSYNSRAILQKLVLFSNNEIAWQFSNCSLVSLMSSTNSIRKEDLGVGNNFRADALHWDITKYFKNNMEELLNSIDYLVVDFIEEQYDIVKYNGSYITKSVAFNESVLNRDLEDGTVLKRTSETMWELWEYACLQFINCLKKYVEPNRIILNKVFLSETFCSKEANKFFAELKYIREINSALAKYYSFFENHLDGIKIVSLKIKDLSFCDKHHTYGCYPYHMNDYAYFELADQIHKIVKNGASNEKSL